MDLHVFSIPIPPPTSLSTRSLWVFPVQVKQITSTGWMHGQFAFMDEYFMVVLIKFSNHFIISISIIKGIADIKLILSIIPVLCQIECIFCIYLPYFLSQLEFIILTAFLTKTTSFHLPNTITD